MLNMLVKYFKMFQVLQNLKLIENHNENNYVNTKKGIKIFNT